MRENGWDLTELYVDNQAGRGLEQLPSKSTVLVLDELARPFLAAATKEQWAALQTVTQKECDLLWVTRGSQINPTEPLGAVCHGVFRTVRAEIPAIHIVTLDVESATMASLTTNMMAIETALRKIKSSKAATPLVECEFAERGGLLHISRVRPDESLNEFKGEDTVPVRPIPIDRLTCFSSNPSRFSRPNPQNIEQIRSFILITHIYL